MLVPPLEQPTSLVLPLGVTTFTVTFPGPVITLVVSITCNCWPLVAEAARVLPLITISDAGTNWLPFTVSITPLFCTSENLTVLGRKRRNQGCRPRAAAKRVEGVVTTGEKSKRNESNKPQT